MKIASAFLRNHPVGSTIWAGRNLASVGVFVENAEDYGGYWTWSAARTYPATRATRAGEPTAEAVISDDGPTGTGSTDGSICPSGWRLPTAQEVADLVGYTGTISGDHAGTVGANGGANGTYNGVKGFAFKGSDGWLFFPYSGYNGGTSSDSIGFYWSGTERDATNAYLLNVNFELTSGLLYWYSKSNHLSVRCVQTKSGGNDGGHI